MTIKEIKNLIGKMCDLVESREYNPILEADLSGLLFHLMITKGKLPPCTLHLNTRVIGAHSNKQHFDLVIGRVDKGEGVHPAVSPEGIIEIKMFPHGFTTQAHSVHFKNILERDLPKLGSPQIRMAMRIEFIFDEADYLSGKYRGQIGDGKYKGKNKKDIIVIERNKKAEGTKIVFARKTKEDWEISVN